MIYVETKIESMLFYETEEEFMKDLVSNIDIKLVKEYRKQLESNDNVRMDYVGIEENKEEEIDGMKKFYYKSIIRYFKKSEIDKVLDDEVIKKLYKSLKPTHFHLSRRIYEIKDKMLSLQKDLSGI